MTLLSLWLSVKTHSNNFISDQTIHRMFCMLRMFSVSGLVSVTVGQS